MKSPIKTRWFAFAVVLSLTAAACTAAVKGATGAGPSSTAPATGSSVAAIMPLPAGADQMRVTIQSPRPGFLLTANSLALHVKANYQLSAAWSGKAVKPGIGHYHVLLDKSLIDMFTTPTARISMQNVTPGPHTLTVVPALNDHQEVLQNAQSITFTYQPTHRLKPITGSTASGQPGVQILQPASGATLSGTFTVKVAFSNFQASTALMGKPDVTGYGHFHVNLDSVSGPMMGMGTMLGMSGSNTFVVSTAGLKPGSTHTLYTVLTDDGHAPLGIMAQIQFTVAGGGAGSGSTAASTSPAPASAAPPAASATHGLTGLVNDHGTQSVSGSSVQLTQGDFYFAPTFVSAPGGKTVSVTVTNDGQALHNFSITSLGIDQDVPPGTSITVNVQLPASGTLAFFCKYHVGAGQQGAFVTS